MPMPEAPENNNNDRGNQPGGKPGLRSKRRSRSWWRHWKKNSRLAEGWRSLVNRFYNWWYPLSDHLEAGYGYGHSRKSRPVRAWNRIQRWIKHSALGRGYRKLSAKWWNWWYPLSDHQGQGYGYGHSPKSRPARAWQRFQRWVRYSAFGRGYRMLSAKWWNWWYPAVDYHGEGYGYGHSPKSRPARAWQRFRRWAKHSAVGRGYRKLSAKWWNWWYPLSDPSDPYSQRTENRLERFLRRSDRWVRKTWLGRKLKWVLDDMADLYAGSRRQFLDIYYSKRLRKWTFRWQTAAWGAFLLALPVAGYTYGWPQLLSYQEEHYAQQAEQLLANGDLKRAMIRCRQVLTFNFNNATATRVFAEVADSYGSPVAIYWRQRALLLAPDVTNQIALASTAVRLEQFPFSTANQVLSGIAPAFQQTPDYQRVAGALALKLSRNQEAEQHFLEAYKLDPDNPVNRMSLAVIQLQSKNPKIITDSRTTLELLMNDRQVGMLATRSLVAESIDRGDFQRAENFSLLLLKNARSSFSDRILHLVILNASHSTNFTSFLKETEERAKASTAHVGELVAWMTASGFARQALDWLNHLPPEFTRQGLLPIAIADAYASLGQWQELADYLRHRPWIGLEHIRFAMMALADAKQTGDLRDSVAWESAVQFAANSPDALNTLAKLASTWGWSERTRDVFWFAVQRYPDQRWPLTALADNYVAQRDTAGMWRVAKAALQKYPDDKLARNNYTMLSLLLDADTFAAHTYAAELYSAEPKNPVFASTYAFSLYKQGRAQAGLKIFQNLPPEQLNNPAMAVYYGILLAASGDAVTAKHYLNQSAKAFLLPEEQALVEQAKIGLLK